MAMVVVLEHHPPRPGVVVASLLGTAVAVGLAELYSEVVGIETRARRRVAAKELRHLLLDVIAVGFGIAFPAVFFVLAAAGAIEPATAFTVAKWSGLGLIGCYGFAAARLAGAALAAALLQAVAVGHRGHADRAQGAHPLNDERLAATAKPSVTRSPPGSPDLCRASGIIEPASITSSAPAAKPSTIPLNRSPVASASA